MTSYFNFRQEVLSKYDQDVYDLIMESFDSLPLSCIVNEKFIALHGGISPELKSVGPGLIFSSMIWIRLVGLESLPHLGFCVIFCGQIRMRMKMDSNKCCSRLTK